MWSLEWVSVEWVSVEYGAGGCGVWLAECGVGEWEQEREREKDGLRERYLFGSTGAELGVAQGTAARAGLVRAALESTLTHAHGVRGGVECRIQPVVSTGSLRR